MTSSDLATYQTNRLAELDTQLALCNQRILRLDQQISSVNQSIAESSSKLTLSLNTLVSAADAWLSQQEANPTTPNLVPKMIEFRDRLLVTKGLDLNDAATIATLQLLAEQVQAFASELVDDLVQQTSTFSEALDKASIDLATHYGVQI